MAYSSGNSFSWEPGQARGWESSLEGVKSKVQNEWSMFHERLLERKKFFCSIFTKVPSSSPQFVHVLSHLICVRVRCWILCFYFILDDSKFNVFIERGIIFDCRKGRTYRWTYLFTFE
ncbi:Uncharacterized protein TCM_024983 [Theobroma cacao]|uniref:Uncharacterized protein n=1 Tax=Theobroma cacao TaxID=3641 RepID=A0A061EXN9_THECC|nr:Uncharacterized protein TCM_024983 [Theobroma cacao]